MAESVASVEKLIGEGRFLEARAIAQNLISSSPEIRLKQLLALAMSKSGALKAAMEFLEPVYKENPADPETSGILGSIYKELFKMTRNSKYAILSRDTYLNNFKATGSYYTGINAASMSAISGSMSKAREIAKEVLALLNEESTDAWEAATMAEAHMLLKEREKSLSFYLKCRNLLGSDWGKVSSIYNQLWLLNHYIPVSNQTMSIFSPPVVAAFVGHMVDHPSRPVARFPESIGPEVKEAIRSAIRSVNAKIGFCSLACGSDIMFAEAMIESGGEVNLFLPFDGDDFIETSVAFAGEEWKERYNKLVSSYPITYITKERYLGSDDLFSFQTAIIFGAAVRRAAMLHGTPHLITVFSDADLKVKEGGTRDTLKLWPLTEKKININPQPFIKDASQKAADGNTTGQTPSVVKKDERRHVRYLALVDFTSCPPEHLERLRHFMDKKTSELTLEDVDRTPVSYLIAFHHHKDAVAFAFEARKLMENDAPAISLHAGPVYITKEGPMQISGPGVTIIKDIQAYGLTGKIYADFQFAAALALDSKEYAIEFAGSLPSATGERLEIFQLNRHADAFDV